MANPIEAVICDCHTHGFTVEADEEYPIVYMASWSYGTAGQRLRFKDKIRYCWRILWHGKPHEDELVLEPDSAQILSDKLSTAVREVMQRKKSG